MTSLEYPIFNFVNILTLYADNEIINYRLGAKFKLSDNFKFLCGHTDYDMLTLGFSFFNNLFNIDYSYMIAKDENLAPYHSHNIGLGINIQDLFDKTEVFYPKY